MELEAKRISSNIEDEKMTKYVAACLDENLKFDGYAKNCQQKGVLIFWV